MVEVAQFRVHDIYSGWKLSGDYSVNIQDSPWTHPNLRKVHPKSTLGD